MKTRELTFMALLLAIGFVLHSVITSYFTGMKPDILLTMMFLGILLLPARKNVLILALGSGIISALTTTFPGGQLPNVIDKLITAFIFYGLYLLAKKVSSSVVTVGILTAIGTLVSGTIFLTSALAIVGLPAPFLALFVAVVLPTAAINTIVIVIVYPIVTNVFKRTKLAYQ